MRLIESKTLTGTQAAIEFTSIPNTFTDLVLLCSLRDNGSDTARAFSLSTNGSDVATRRVLVGQGSSASSNTSYIAVTNGNTSAANTFANVSFYIPNYTSTVTKSISCDFVTEDNATTAFQGISAGISAGTAAITSLSVSANSASWVAGSMVSLYGVLKGSDGIVTTSP